MSDYEDEGVFWDTLRRILGLPEDYNWADATAALDRIEAEYNKWQDLFADLVDENARLHARVEEHNRWFEHTEQAIARLRRIEEAAREHLAYDGDYCPNAKRLRPALEGGDPGA